jgi:hypothetical protein
MGPRIRKTQAYQDALRIIEEDEDGEANMRTKRGRSKATKPRTRAAPPKKDVNTTPKPPTDASKVQIKMTREKRREDRLVCNQEERDAHDMGVFFPDATDTSSGMFSLIVM